MDGNPQEGLPFHLPHEDRVEGRHAPLLAGGSRPDMVSGIVDALELALIAIDEAGRFAGANEAGLRLLRRGDGLKLNGAIIMTQSAAEYLDLKCAIDRAIGMPHRLQELRVMLVSRLDRQPLTVAVVQGGNSLFRKATAHLAIVDPETEIDDRIIEVCRLYRLSKAETKICRELVNGRSLSEISDQLSLKETTVRAYLKQIFSKCGVHRQSSLIRLLLTSRIPMQLS